MGNGSLLHLCCQCLGAGQGANIPTTQEVCRCQGEVSCEEQKAGINTAEALQPGSIWPLDPPLFHRAVGSRLAGAKLVTGLWPGVGSLQLGGLKQCHPSHHQQGSTASDTSLSTNPANPHPRCTGPCRDVKYVPGTWSWKREGALSEGSVVTIQVSKQ